VVGVGVGGDMMGLPGELRAIFQGTTTGHYATGYLWIKKRQNLSAKTHCNFRNAICSVIFIVESSD
jgi:hypothetical protein